MSIFSQVGYSRLFGKHKEALDLFSAGNSKDAILMLLDLAEAEPTNALVCVDIGRVVLQMGLPDQAVVAARQALELDETSVEALTLLASAQEKLGEYNDALVALRRIIELQNDPQRTVEDIEKEKIQHPLTVPEYGATFLSFRTLGDSSNLTLKAVTEDKNKSGIIYITIAGEGTDDAHPHHTLVLEGEMSRGRLLKSLPDDQAATVSLFPGEKFKYKFLLACGVTETKREQELVVAFTVDSSRVAHAIKTADLLLNQAFKPDHVILWLSEDPTVDLTPGTMPESLKMHAQRGLEVRWCPDTGSLRGYAETRKAFPNALIVTADVNVRYNNCWLDQLYKAYTEAPDSIHCHCAHQILYSGEGNPLPFARWNHLAKGEQGPLESIYPVCSAGAIFAPDHLPETALDASAFDEYAGGNLDAWLKAMSLTRQVKCRKVFLKSMDISKIRHDDSYVADASVADVCIDEHIAALARKYNVFHCKG